MNTPFLLPSELTIYSTTETRNALLAWVSERTSNSDSLEISARDVSEIDGSGLQMLAALSNMDQSWQLVESSKAFTEACQTMGFAHWLEQSQLKNKGEKNA